MTAPRIATAARARAKGSGPAASREVLLEGLTIAAKLAADENAPSTARTRALAELRQLAKALDDLEAVQAAETPVSSPWGSQKLTAV